MKSSFAFWTNDAVEMTHPQDFTYFTCSGNARTCDGEDGEFKNHDSATLSLRLTNENAKNLRDSLNRIFPTEPKPLRVRLECPNCHQLHVDEGAFATEPHHTHQCDRCGHCWRPAVEPTVGVRFLFEPAIRPEVEEAVFHIDLGRERSLLRDEDRRRVMDADKQKTRYWPLGEKSTMPERKHFVTFLSPGSLVDEVTTKPVEAWEPATACLLARDVSERHGAKPYGFYFKTLIVAEPIDDGEGGKLKVEPREVAQSGTYFLGGTVINYDDVSARCIKNDTSWWNVLFNMQGNDFAFVIENVNSYKTTRPFAEKDAVVDATSGSVLERGDSPERMAYRKRFIEENEQRRTRELAELAARREGQK